MLNFTTKSSRDVARYSSYASEKGPSPARATVNGKQKLTFVTKSKTLGGGKNEALVTRIAIDAQRIEYEETDRCGRCGVGWFAWETAAVYDPDPAIAEPLLAAQKRSSKFFGWKVRGRQDKTYVCPRCALQKKVVARRSDPGRMARSKAAYDGCESMVPC